MDQALSRLFRPERRVAPVDFDRSEAQATANWSPDARRTGRRPVGAEETAAEPAPRSIPLEEVEAERAAWAAREIELMEQLEVGRREGHDAGLAEREDEVDSMREELGDSIRALGEHADAMSARYRDEAIELALQLAHAIVGDALRYEPDALREVVERALASVPRTPEALLRCHPADLEAIEALVPAATARRGDPIAIRAVAVPGIEPGGCIIDFEEGAVDARPSVAIDVMREAIEAAMAGRHAGDNEGSKTDEVDP